jgi:putative endonuclease
METYSVYILYSESLDRYYTGHTKDVMERLNQHNAGRTPSTKSGRPWIIAYTESFGNKASASAREAEIKRMKSRSYIESLITVTKSLSR